MTLDCCIGLSSSGAYLVELSQTHRGPLSVNQPHGLRHKAAQLLGARALALRRQGEPLGVCIMTADFWGLKSAGGTATAYHLLAQVEIRSDFASMCLDLPKTR